MGSMVDFDLLIFLSTLANLIFVLFLIGPGNSTRPLLAGYAVWAVLVMLGSFVRLVDASAAFLAALRVISVTVQSGTLLLVLLRRKQSHG